ncbi:MULTISPECIES: diguanylate cyclase domain-containing protein [unclassified Shewanella]|uniref:diguanylate cyclase domain-containing protein n=1 Tax=unclassified Shewanella TaxID=196818 RepID=UPI001603B667|nr:MULTISPECIES: diguanylate cyclase [unclassified Shewanella]MBB1320981.1 diguanylate cyclase [Shewanella sp. SR43-8]MBB1475369.1 diguanylate cyclase [Shewanella sp. SG41-3]|tara:strand:+ start:1573 stop:2901 length:1329 start_codon:yes stop_codon:yes gene_type:complete
MMLSKRLKLTAALCSLLTLIVGLSLIQAHHYQQQIYRQLNYSMKLQVSIDSLRSQLWLYQEYSDDRGLSELNLRQAELAKDLSEDIQWATQQKLIISNINRLNTNIRSLINTQHDFHSKQVNVASTLTAERLFKAKYSMIIEEMTEEMFRLHQFSIKKASQKQQTLLLMVGMVLFLLAIMVTAWSIMTLIRFKKGLASLKIGMEALAAGDLVSQINSFDTDELSALADDFNEMKQSLAQITIKKEKLKQEVDIQTRKLIEQQDKLIFLAEHDELTGIYNRRAFIKQIDAAIARDLRGEQQAALLFIDLNKFKEINDSLGHSIGDEVIMTIANRLVNNLRTTDIVGRLGGDEFIIWLDMITEPIDIKNKINQLLSSIKQPITIGEHTLQVGASIGISVLPDDGLNSRELISAADTAMYQAKADHRTEFCFYTDDHRVSALATS